MKVVIKGDTTYKYELSIDDKCESLYYKWNTSLNPFNQKYQEGNIRIIKYLREVFFRVFVTYN